MDVTGNFEEEKYKEFFEWLLNKKVKMNKEVDIALIMTHKKPYIYYPDEVKQLFETSAMKRSGKITQLGTTICSIPTTSSTRLPHEKGAGNNAVKFYLYQFQKQKWRKENQSEEKRVEILANIIQMYTHDIGHNILSHTLEKLIKNNNQDGENGAAHEILGRRILNENKEISQVLKSIHPKLLEALNQVSKNDYSLKTLKEGSVDFDRLDFVVRDVLYFGADENQDLSERILSQCNIERINVRGNTYDIPVFEYQALADIEKFLEDRAFCYKTIHYSNENIAREYVTVHFCDSLIKSDYECDLKLFINHCIAKRWKRN